VIEIAENHSEPSLMDHHQNHKTNPRVDAIGTTRTLFDPRKSISKNVVSMTSPRRHNSQFTSPIFLIEEEEPI
jgi:hypothetical protein